MRLEVIWDNGFKETVENANNIKITKDEIQIPLFLNVTQVYHIKDLKEVKLYNGDDVCFTYEIMSTDVNERG